MRRVLPAFSPIWIPVCFGSLMVGYGTVFPLGLLLVGMGAIRPGSGLLMLLVSGLFIGIIQKGVIRRTLSLDDRQRRGLGAKWTIATIIGWTVSWMVGISVGWLEYQIWGRMLGFLLVLAVTPIAMATCQGYVLHRIFNGHKDDGGGL